MNILFINTDTLLHPFNGLFSWTTWVRRYQKGKTSLDLNEVRGDGVLGCSDARLCLQCFDAVGWAAGRESGL